MIPNYPIGVVEAAYLLNKDESTVRKHCRRMNYHRVGIYYVIRNDEELEKLRESIRDYPGPRAKQ